MQVFFDRLASVLLAKWMCGGQASEKEIINVLLLDNVFLLCNIINIQLHHKTYSCDPIALTSLFNFVRVFPFTF